MQRIKLSKSIWIYWIISVLFVFYQFILQVFIGPCLNKLAEDMQVSVIKIGQVSALFYYAFAIMLIPIGFMIDRNGPRKCLTIGALLCATGCFIFAVSPNLTVMSIGRIIMGIGGASAFAGTMKLISLWFHAENIGLMTGLTITVAMLGAISGQTIIEHLFQVFDWRLIITIIGFSGFILSMLIFNIIKEPLKKYNLKTSVGIKNILKKTIKNKETWRSAFFASLIYLPLPVFSGLWAIPYFSSELNIKINIASHICSFTWLGMAFGSPFWGWLSDHFISKYLTMKISAICSAVILATILYKSWLSINDLSFLLFILGFFCGTYSLAFSKLREVNIPELSGLSVSFAMTVVMVIIAVATQTIGYLLFHTANNYRFSLTIIPLFLVLSAIIVKQNTNKN